MFKKRRPPSSLRFLFYAAGRWNRRWAPTAVDLVPRAFLWKKKWEGCAGSPGYEAGPQYGPHVRWFVGTKHFPESKNTFKYPKHVHPRIQNTVPRIQKGFGFWDVFCPYELRYSCVRCAFTRAKSSLFKQ